MTVDMGSTTINNPSWKYKLTFIIPQKNKIVYNFTELERGK